MSLFLFPFSWLVVCACGGVDRNLYTIRAVPLTEVRSIRRHTPALGWQYIIVVLSTGKTTCTWFLRPNCICVATVCLVALVDTLARARSNWNNLFRSLCTWYTYYLEGKPQWLPNWCAQCSQCGVIPIRMTNVEVYILSREVKSYYVTRLPSTFYTIRIFS